MSRREKEATVSDESWRKIPRIVIRAALLGVLLPALTPPMAFSQRPNAGLSGYEILSYGMDVVAGNTGVLERACTSGKKPLGGGFYFPGAAIVSDPGNVHVMESSPRVTTSGTTGWRVVAWNRTQSTQRMEVWVICGNASP
jgi:hypothetical protein